MPMPAELRDLILRFNRIGCLLGSVDEDAIKSGDAAAIANAQVIINEMNKTKAEIDAFIDLHRQH
jgi:hypothetical protein